MPVRVEAIAPSKRRWADLRLRILSGVVLAAAGLTGWWLGGVAWAMLIAAAAAGLAAEWLGLCRRAPNGLRRWAALFAGAPYIGLAVAALLWLRADGPAGGRAVLFVLLVVWASDIGAYLAGRALGGPLLAPAISPGKTWAGAAGGLAAAVLAGLVVGCPESAGRATLAGAVLGIAAQSGDLLESAIKRGFGVKDSGTLIPGHGGLFDRLDGILTAAPVAALLAMRVGHGVVFWR